MAAAISANLLGCVNPMGHVQCESPLPPPTVDLSKIHVFAGDSLNEAFTRKVKNQKFMLRCKSPDIDNYVAISYEDFLTLNTMVKYCADVDLE